MIRLDLGDRVLEVGYVYGVKAVVLRFQAEKAEMEGTTDTLFDQAEEDEVTPVSPRYSEIPPSAEAESGLTFENEETHIYVKGRGTLRVG